MDYSYVIFSRKWALTFHATKETICMKCQVFFLEKNIRKKYFKMSSAEISAQSVKSKHNLTSL